MSTTDDLPRDPSAWRPTNHFVERFKDLYAEEPPRHLSGDIVDGCIRNGDVTTPATQRGVYYLDETFGGVTYRLVVAARKGLVLTGYPVAIDDDTAEASHRWTPDELRDIRAHVAADVDYHHDAP